MATFKQIETTGASLADAMANVSEYFTLNENGDVKGDATQAYKKWVESGKPKSEFFAAYLEKKKAIAGEAYRVTDCPAVADTRERPYKYTNIKREGTTKVRKTWYWLDKATGTEVFKITSTADDRATKAEAVDAMKKLIASGQYKGTAELYSRMEEEKPTILGVMEYTPSKSSHPGTWTVFGICKD